MWPYHVSAAFFAAFTAQYFVITLTLYLLDLYKRWRQQKEKPIWIHGNYLPSWTHIRFTVVYVIVTTLIFFNLLITESLHVELFLFAIPVCWTIHFMTDWWITVMSASTFLLIRFQKKINPVGTVVAIVGTVAYVANITLFVLSYYAVVAAPYPYRAFSAIQTCIYLAVSLSLDAIYFEITKIFVFDKDSSVCAGIYGFLDGFVRPVFRACYCLTKYVICIALLLVTLRNPTGFDVRFHLHVLPFLLEIWFIALWFTARKNRPSPPECLELKVWRPFVQKFWAIAVARYNRRNKIPLTRKCQWKDAKQIARDLKELERKDLEKKIARKAKMATPAPRADGEIRMSSKSAPNSTTTTNCSTSVPEKIEVSDNEHD